jgi:hypothetical protein
MRLFLLCIFCWMAALSVVSAQQPGEFASVVTKSGQVFEGTVVKHEIGEAITLRQRDGIEIRVLYTSMKYPPQTPAPAAVPTPTVAPVVAPAVTPAVAPAPSPAVAPKTDSSPSQTLPPSNVSRDSTHTVSDSTARRVVKKTTRTTVDTIRPGSYSNASKKGAGDKAIGLAIFPQLGLTLDFVDVGILIDNKTYKGAVTSPLRIQPSIITGFYVKDIFMMGVGLGVDAGWYTYPLRRDADLSKKRLPDRRVSVPLFFHFQLRVRNSQLNPNWHLDMGYQFFGVPGFLIGSGSGININVAKGIGCTFDGGMRLLLGGIGDGINFFKGVQAYLKFGVMIRR